MERRSGPPFPTSLLLFSTPLCPLPAAAAEVDVPLVVAVILAVVLTATVLLPLIRLPLDRLPRALSKLPESVEETRLLDVLRPSLLSQDAPPAPRPVPRLMHARLPRHLSAAAAPAMARRPPTSRSMETMLPAPSARASLSERTRMLATARVET
jgi:hypothetical protein